MTSNMVNFYKLLGDDLPIFFCVVSALGFFNIFLLVSITCFYIFAFIKNDIKRLSEIYLAYYL